MCTTYLNVKTVDIISSGVNKVYYDPIRNLIGAYDPLNNYGIISKIDLRFNDWLTLQDSDPTIVKNYGTFKVGLDGVQTGLRLVGITIFSKDNGTLGEYYPSSDGVSVTVPSPNPNGGLPYCTPTDGSSSRNGRIIAYVSNKGTLGTVNLKLSGLGTAKSMKVNNSTLGSLYFSANVSKEGGCFASGNCCIYGLFKTYGPTGPVANGSTVTFTVKFEGAAPGQPFPFTQTPRPAQLKARISAYPEIYTNLAAKPAGPSFVDIVKNVDCVSDANNIWTFQVTFYNTTTVAQKTMIDFYDLLSSGSGNSAHELSDSYRRLYITVNP